MIKRKQMASWSSLGAVLGGKMMKKSSIPLPPTLAYGWRRGPGSRPLATAKALRQHALSRAFAGQASRAAARFKGCAVPPTLRPRPPVRRRSQPSGLEILDVFFLSFRLKSI